MDEWGKFNEISLPEKGEFYSNLNMEDFLLAFMYLLIEWHIFFIAACQANTVAKRRFTNKYRCRLHASKNNL